MIFCSNSTLYSKLIKKKVNGKRATLPLHGDNFSVSLQNKVIVFTTPYFTVTYDGIHLLKIRTCSRHVNGVCGNNNNVSADDNRNPDRFLVNQPSRNCFARRP